MDALDYTPQQALNDASVAAAHHDFDGAILILFNHEDERNVDITHFVSGATGPQIVSYLELLKTKFSLRVLGLGHEDY